MEKLYNGLANREKCIVGSIYGAPEHQDCAGAFIVWCYNSINSYPHKISLLFQYSVKEGCSGNALSSSPL